MAFGGAMRVFVSVTAVAVAFIDQSIGSDGFLASKQKALSEMKEKTVALKKQMKKNKPHLPNASAVLTVETAVFHQFQEKANSLMKRLALAEEEGGAALFDSKAKYEVTLKAQHEQNLAVERKNEEIALEVAAIYDATADARSAASELTKKNEGLTDEFRALRHNFTTAQEFAENAINDSTAQLAYSTPELQVLDELNQQEAEEKQAREHENYLQWVATAGSKLSFLQIDASNKVSVESSMDSLVQHHLNSRAGPKKDVSSVEEVVNELAATLEELSNAQNASDAQLRTMFEEEYKKNDDNYQALLQLQAELNATKDSALELQGRVFEAKDHLQEAYTKLVGQVEAVKHFTYQVGAGEKAAALIRVSNKHAKKKSEKKV